MKLLIANFCSGVRQDTDPNSLYFVVLVVACAVADKSCSHARKGSGVR